MPWNALKSSNKMRLNLLFSIIVGLVFSFESAWGSRLSVSGNKFIFNGKSVFLSGVNFAWKFYGYDFGNGQYAANSKTTFEQWLKEVATYGGNSVRKLFQITLIRLTIV